MASWGWKGLSVAEPQKTRCYNNITRNLVNGLIGMKFNQLFLLLVTYGSTHFHLCVF